MKRLFTTILLVLMVLSLCACESSKKDKVPATGSNLSWEQIEKQAEKELD